MPVVSDQTGKEIFINGFPRRIISLVPSQTELLYDLGLASEVVGITRFCVHPSQWFRQKERIGGTKQLNVGKIKDLNPDLILANKEENVKEQVQELEKNFPVWASDVQSLGDALDMIRSVGKICGKEERAESIAGTIQENFALLPPAKNPKIKCCYLIWQKPYMTVGGDTFIHNMLQYAGYENVFASRSRYPETTIEEIQSLAPKVVFLSSEPYPFKEVHVNELQFLLPAGKVLLVDGELFSWYGSRLLKSAAYFKELQTECFTYFR